MQQQLQFQSQLQKPILANSLVELQDAIITERNAEMEKVRDDMVQLNQLFKTVGAEINAQSEIVDTIANNITHANRDVKAAGKQIEYAEKEANSANKLYMYLAGGIGGGIAVGGAILASVLLL